MPCKTHFHDCEGFVLGPWHELDLDIPPREGDLVTLAADGLETVTYKVQQVTMIIHRSLDGELSQHIDVVVSHLDC